MKEKYINAIIWMFGFTKKQATKFYTDNKNNTELLNTILTGHNNNAKKTFYND